MRPHVIVPTLRNVRFHRALALWCVVCAVALLAMAAYVMAHGQVGRATPMMAAVAALSAMIGVFKLQGLASTLAHQHRQLAARGRTYRAERVSVERMRRGALTHFHVVVAQFRTERGAMQEALSDTFDYDPGPLLDLRSIDVVADPYEPALCVVDSDSLPPRVLRNLSDAQRRELGTLSRLHHAVLIGGSILAVAMFLYAAVQLVRLRF